jgi:hypothetical protein
MPFQAPAGVGARSEAAFGPEKVAGVKRQDHASQQERREVVADPGLSAENIAW